MFQSQRAKSSSRSEHACILPARSKLYMLHVLLMNLLNLLSDGSVECSQTVSIKPNYPVSLYYVNIISSLNNSAAFCTVVVLNC